MIRNELRSAVAHRQFHVHYQPIIDLATHRITAAEALIRWTHPTLGPISPSEFVPIAEESSLIIELGAYVLEQACHDAAGWVPPIRLSVNVSALQFRDPEFLTRLEHALERSGLPPTQLDVELTERVILDENEKSFDTINKIHHLGVRIVLDDLGTGHASLATLTRFEFDGVKLDGKFSKAVTHDAKAQMFVRSISRIGTDLKLSVIAEGIESHAQLSLMADLGITHGQGFFIAPPMDAFELSTHLDRAVQLAA